MERALFLLTFSIFTIDLKRFLLKRFLAISLLGMYLTSFTEVHELFRLPLLLEHFAEHKTQVDDMSFVEFLVMHYKTDVAHDDHDNQLPFKVLGHCFTAQAIALPIQKVLVFETAPLATVSHTFKYTEASFSSPVEAIFQPPKLA
jgi:hypothetical protein